MKTRFIKKGIFFSIFVLILVLMNDWMDREGSPHYSLQYDEALHPKVNADVVILGASNAAHGINPKYLEKDHLKVFNFSLNGAGPYFYLKWYRKIFQRNYKKPECVIYGVNWMMFADHRLQRQIENDSRYIPLDIIFSEFRDLKTLNTLVLNRFPFIRGRRELPERFFGLFQKHARRSPFILSGYYNGFIPYERKGRLDKQKGSKPQHDRVQISAFEELLDEFKKDKIRVILVGVPGYLPSRSDANISEAMQLIHKIADERQIPFLDYETKRISDLNVNPDFFSDWIHLNEKGSVAFSELLRGDLDSLLKQRTVKD